MVISKNTQGMRPPSHLPINPPEKWVPIDLIELWN